MSCSHHIKETALCNRNFKCNFSLTFFSQVLQFIFNNTYILKVRFSLKLLLYMCLDHKGKFYKNWVICPLFQSCFHQLKKVPSLPFSLCCRSIIVSATFLQLLLEHTWLLRWYRILLCEEFQRTPHLISLWFLWCIAQKQRVLPMPVSFIFVIYSPLYVPCKQITEIFFESFSSWMSTNSIRQIHEKSIFKTLSDW